MKERLSSRIKERQKKKKKGKTEEKKQRKTEKTETEKEQKWRKNIGVEGNKQTNKTKRWPKAQKGMSAHLPDI